MKDISFKMNHDSQYGMSTSRMVRNPSPRQSGAVLVMSLVMLMILTILGIAAMNTSSLETKMSGNTQANTQARSAAESGLDKIVNTITKLDPSTSIPPTGTNTYTYGTSTANVSVKFVESDLAGRGNVCGAGNSAQNFQVYNFDAASTGTTVQGGRSIVHQGLCQLGAAN